MGVEKSLCFGGKVDEEKATKNIFERKESARKASFPSLSILHMNSTQTIADLQDRIDAFASKMAGDKLLAEFFPKEALRDFLYEGLSQLLNSSLQHQRKIHLERSPDDRANGYAPARTLYLGTTPVDIEIPRSREGFYPPLLPKYQRQIPQTYADLLRQILIQAKSFKAAIRTMQDLHLGYSQAQVEEHLNELYTEAKNFNLRPLSPDWYSVFIDAKVIHLKDEHDHVLEAIHFLAIGYGTNGKKEVLTAATFWGKEQLDSWRKVLLDLKNRGLTRCLMFITDDFTGLAPLLKSLFPGSHHQLCTVHLHRNAFRHLDRNDYPLYKQAWREILASSSYDAAVQRFQKLLDELRPRNPSWIKHLESRTENYLAFFHYPRGMHPFLRTTNLPEGINNMIETMRRNAGGHFHSEREAHVKMKLLIDQLHNTRWKHQLRRISGSLQDLAQLFQKRFEQELP